MFDFIDGGALCTCFSIIGALKHTRCFVVVTLKAFRGDQIYNAITLINFDYFHLPANELLLKQEMFISGDNFQ